MGLYGAIEAGGTKFVCAVANDCLEVKERISLPTTTPEETMAGVIDFFNQYRNELLSIGVGSFGPIDVNLKSDTYGYITTTPKPGWANYNMVGALKDAFDIPIAWTTDVNAAAYGELKKGAARGKNSCIYITVGTGIGGGIVVDGQILQGYGHPELGHILIRPHQNDSFEGRCPFHGNCLEGMAAGPAIEERYGIKGQDLTSDHEAWQLEAYYLAQALVDYTVTLSPEMIIFGGGVMHQAQLFPMIRQSFKEQLHHYVQTPALDEYIVPCALGDNAGITGCLLLAKEMI